MTLRIFKLRLPDMHHATQLLLIYRFMFHCLPHGQGVVEAVADLTTTIQEHMYILLS